MLLALGSPCFPGLSVVMGKETLTEWGPENRVYFPFTETHLYLNQVTFAFIFFLSQLEISDTVGIARNSMGVVPQDHCPSPEKAGEVGS